MLGKKVPRPVGLIPCNFCVLHIKVVCFIFVFVKNCLFLYLSQGGKRPIGSIPCVFLCYIIRLFVIFSCL